MVVTFAGHGDAPQTIGIVLYEVLEKLIQEGEADTFYVGNHGNFDKAAFAALQKLRKIYPYIICRVVLAYMPDSTGKEWEMETIFPAEVSLAPVRFAIDRRNRWMLSKSDVVVTYVVRSYGGAATFKKKALLSHKRVIELSEGFCKV